MKQVRVDLLMVEKGLAESRAKAQRLVMAGEVRVNGELVLKPSAAVPVTAKIDIRQKPRYVSRGGEKLAAALLAFDVQLEGKICADVGASTGGFTDCMLQHGARLVYAIDVGKGILHWNLRNDPRIVVLEGTNARYIDRLPQKIDFSTIDASFISLQILLPVVRGWFSIEESSDPKSNMGNGDVIALIKPQFEAGRSVASRASGVIRDPLVHQAVLENILSFAQNQGFQIKGLIRSPILGPKGNTEFLVWLQTAATTDNIPDEEFINTLIQKLFI